jgi:hypothetical protein
MAKDKPTVKLTGKGRIQLYLRGPEVTAAEDAFSFLMHLYGDWAEQQGLLGLTAASAHNYATLALFIDLYETQIAPLERHGFWPPELKLNLSRTEALLMWETSALISGRNTEDHTWLVVLGQLHQTLS